MDSDEQSTELFDKLTFEFTLSNIDTDSDSDSDSESDMSVEYMGTNIDSRQTQNCATGTDEEIEFLDYVNLHCYTTHYRTHIHIK